MDTNPAQHDEDDQRFTADLVRGAERIAEVLAEILGEPVSADQVYYWHKKKRWPFTKHGADLIASRKKLHSHGRKLTAD